MARIDDLKTAMDNAAAALAAVTSTTAGGIPNVLGGGGGDADHQGYVKTLQERYDGAEVAYLRAVAQASADAGNVGFFESEEWT